MCTSFPLFAARVGTAFVVVFCLCLLAPRAAWAEWFEEDSSSPSPFVSRTPRVRLLRVAPGFLSDPIDLRDDDLGLPGVPSMPGSNQPPAPAQPANGPEWIQFGAGYDNPFVDLRLPGDPGGVGYYRVNTQVQLFDSPTTACTFGVQAVTPAGIQFGGLPTGPTVFCPAFSVFHSLGQGTALQGFVAKNVPISGTAEGPSFLQRNVQYGMAVQRPIATDGPEGLRNVFLSVGALGQFSAAGGNFNALPTYDVLPGLQWHVNDNWWVSSGVLFPVGPTTTRTAPSQWQLTCSFQF
jgi:hypothetical protein